MYGRQTECAIAAMSRLAEVYDGGKTRLSAADIADARGLPRPFVAKILSLLSQAGLVIGSRGPGGGAALARHPAKIRLYDVFRLFEREDERRACPFGGGVCGDGDPCPLHHKLTALHDALHALLYDTTFDEFRVAYRTRSSQPPRKLPSGLTKTAVSPHARRLGTSEKHGWRYRQDS
ncbi:MAG: Rrf2 family transcriptional regulator [Phycisphaerae bacterium]|nr:Rrf2 family transcriptional regulator [Phycisphaerae bacterium]